MKNKKGSSDLSPLVYSLAFILIFTFAVAPVVSMFGGQDRNTQNLGIVQPLYDFVSDGITLFSFSVNPFEWLGEDIQGYFLDVIVGLSLLPEIILYPFILFTITCFVLTIIKLLPTT